MRVPPALSLLVPLVAVSGCAGPADDRDGQATEVAGVVIERDDPPAAGQDPADGIVLQPGPAAEGIIFSVVEGDWVGLGARTLTDDGATQHLTLDVAVGGEEVNGILPEARCELALQASDDAPLIARGELEATLVVGSPSGDARRVVLAPAVVDVVLAPGELYRAALTDEGGVDLDATEAAGVRCEGRFSHT